MHSTGKRQRWKRIRNCAYLLMALQAVLGNQGQLRRASTSPPDLASSIHRCSDYGEPQVSRGLSEYQYANNIQRQHYSTTRPPSPTLHQYRGGPLSAYYDSPMKSHSYHRDPRSTSRPDDPHAERHQRRHPSNYKHKRQEEHIPVTNRIQSVRHHDAHDTGKHLHNHRQDSKYNSSDSSVVSKPRSNYNSSIGSKPDQPRKTSSNISLDVEDDPEEIRRREERRKRFAIGSSSRQLGEPLGVTSSVAVTKMSHQTPGHGQASPGIEPQTPKSDERPALQTPWIWKQSSRGEWYCANPVTLESRWSPPPSERSDDDNTMKVDHDRQSDHHMKQPSSQHQHEDVYDPEAYQIEAGACREKGREVDESKRAASPVETSLGHNDGHDRKRMRTRAPVSGPGCQDNNGSTHSKHSDKGSAVGMGGVSPLSDGTSLDYEDTNDTGQEDLTSPHTAPVEIGRQSLLSSDETVTLLPLTPSPSSSIISDWKMHKSRHDPDFLAYQRIQSVLPCLKQHLVGDQVWNRVQALVAKFGTPGDLEQEALKSRSGGTVASPRTNEDTQRSDEQERMVDLIHAALMNMFDVNKEAMPWLR
ncbi:hypothetical protein SeLEV6574_g04794 [Synchytrium endobioticum]|uniref:WW domain-containing protein n=1 Tax=Synchytrium endobioticum TaxID=286115 RepID=A0A507CXK3_9FUNG|nr:hypothetical protein SeLEV6574_g04794 [Synchytrium endobioticum]